MYLADLSKKLLSTYSVEVIECAAIQKFLESRDMSLADINIPLIKRFQKIAIDDKIVSYFNEYKPYWSLKDIENLFESLIDSKIKKEGGIVFTPEYIVKYILRNTINKINNSTTILDPACGCGAFLVHATEYLSEKLSKSIVDVLEENIFGIDINIDNIDRLKIILALLCIEHGENPVNISFNIFNIDALKIDTGKNDLFSFFTKQDFNYLFDYIIGNPPYINTHDISTELNEYLKYNFTTTSAGVYNIFYAFIELGLNLLKPNGRLGFIVPNNFIVIEAAEPLRKFLQYNRSIFSMVDFGCNVPFNPVKTYNAIVILDKSEKSEFEYNQIEFTHDIEYALQNTSKIKIPYSQLNPHSWRLLSQNDLDNIAKIESAGKNLSASIRTGIATLSDNLYFIDKSKSIGNYYIKEYNGNNYKIEKTVVKKIIKIGSLIDEKAINNSSLGIIFPYFINPEKNSSNVFEIIPEELFAIEYPYCYKYFLDIKSLLSKRDKGKCNPVVWYAYGRTQGLNTYGRKLVFPTFSNKPKFIIDNDLESLFCNGYAVFIDGLYYDLDILQKILNSEVMNYYISKTSYSIEGGFKCYQKKYIKNFSIPPLSVSDTEFLKNTNILKEINKFLIEKYKLSL